MASPVNIADFRCRAIRSRAHSSFRAASRPSGFALVSSKPAEPISFSSAAICDNPRIYDIGVAREMQRMRQRNLFRPISIQRRAKVLRFREEPAQIPAAVRSQAHAWNRTFDDPYDLPPAA